MKKHQKTNIHTLRLNPAEENLITDLIRKNLIPKNGFTHWIRECIHFRYPQGSDTVVQHFASSILASLERSQKEAKEREVLIQQLRKYGYEFDPYDKKLFQVSPVTLEKTEEKEPEKN